jgi:hypothetical protein
MNPENFEAGQDIDGPAMRQTAIQTVFRISLLLWQIPVTC